MFVKFTTLYDGVSILNFHLLPPDISNPLFGRTKYDCVLHEDPSSSSDGFNSMAQFIPNTNELDGLPLLQVLHVEHSLLS